MIPGALVKHPPVIPLSPCEQRTADATLCMGSAQTRLLPARIGGRRIIELRGERYRCAAGEGHLDERSTAGAIHAGVHPVNVGRIDGDALRGALPRGECRVCGTVEGDLQHRVEARPIDTGGVERQGSGGLRPRRERGHRATGDRSLTYVRAVDPVDACGVDRHLAAGHVCGSELGHGEPARSRSATAASPSDPLSRFPSRRSSGSRRCWSRSCRSCRRSPGHPHCHHPGTNPGAAVVRRVADHPAAAREGGRAEHGHAREQSVASIPHPLPPLEHAASSVNAWRPIVEC